MRRQRWELGPNGSVMFVVRTDQDAMPVPATGFRWLNENQHLTPEKVGGQATEHCLAKKSPMISQRIENPFVFERLHLFRPLKRLAASTPLPGC
jgi:hypothetical protein